MRSALIRLCLVGACCALLLTGAVFAPLGMREIDAFNVRSVEVIGMRYLSAEDAVAASGITDVSNIFDDPQPWLDALRAHPLVLDAQLKRRLPSTLLLRITESKPVAFARTPELRAIDERGRVLPADPAADGMDLPVLAVSSRISGEGVAADMETLAIAAFLGTVGRTEPGLLGWISEAGMRGDAVRLVLRNATDAEVFVPAAPTPARLRELHLTIIELSSPQFAIRADAAPATGTTYTAEPELARVKSIDGRFLDQIVVALHRGKN